MRRTFIIGDSHGLFEELVELVEKVLGFRPDIDDLKSVGDMVDKGPYSSQVVDYFRLLGADVVRGNHEEKHIKYRKHWIEKQKNPAYEIKTKWPDEYANVFKTLSPAQLDWMSALPKTITFGEDNSWIMVHAGLDHGVPLEKQAKCLWLRYIHKDTGAMIPFDGTPGVPENGVWWAERWKGPQKVVYGHQPWDGRVRVENGTYGIDTGAVHGRYLTALVFEGTITSDAKPAIVQVKSKMVYSPDINNE